LIKLLFTEWQQERYAEKLHNRQLVFVCGKECYHLTSDDAVTVSVKSVAELASLQEEADTRIILHLHHIASNSSESTNIMVRSPDTDVLVLLLYHTESIKQNIFFDTGNGNKRRLLDVKGIIASNQDICHVLPAFHAFSGCDTTSAFVRRGKAGPLKALKKSSDFKGVFSALRKSASVSNDLHVALEKFVCTMYGKPNYTDINKLRYDLFTERFQSKSQCVLSNYDGIDLSLLPPCRTSLHMHVLRANYQALIWNNAHKAFPDIPSPVGNGWKRDEGTNEIAFEWTSGPILPVELIDIISNAPENENDNEDNFDMCHSLEDELFNDDM
jgi:hypothetical protein